MPEPADPALVPRLLEEYGALVRAALQAYLEPQGRRSPLSELISDYPARGGRMLRPSLSIAAARAFGGAGDAAVTTAVALELLHNAFLVHDDIEDESVERRGRPTLHRTQGVPIAINVGDALTLLSLRPLIDNFERLGPRLALRVLEESQRMALETVEGQSIELAWRRDNAVSLSDADYFEMTLKKTCWYTAIYPLRVGALIGSRDSADLDRLIRFGFFLGAAFQIQDDLLNLVGDPARYGKELGGDLCEGKRTLMLIHLLRQASPAERSQLADWLALPRGTRTESDVQWIRKRMELYGSIEYARQIAHGLAGAALHEFSSVFAALPDSRDRRFIEGLPAWVIERS